VGGQQFITTRTTLGSQHAEGSNFSSGVACHHGTIFFDRNPKHFAKVLDFLRDGWCAVSQTDLVELRELRAEADFYNICALKTLIDDTFAMRAFLRSLAEARRRQGEYSENDSFEARSFSKLPFGANTLDPCMLSAIMKTASKAELNASEALQSSVQSLSVRTSSGEVLGEIHVKSTDLVGTLLPQEGASSPLSASLLGLFERAVDYDDTVKQQIDATRCGGNPACIRDCFSLLTRTGRDLFDEHVLRADTFELLGLQDGETLTVVRKAVQTELGDRLNLFSQPPQTMSGISPSYEDGYESEDLTNDEIVGAPAQPADSATALPCLLRSICSMSSVGSSSSKIIVRPPVDPNLDFKVVHEDSLGRLRTTPSHVTGYARSFSRDSE
jgi:hypothetical protein